EDVRLGKPDPEVYLLAARGIGVPPRECLVFEDSVVGIQAARRAGMRVIGVATAHTADELRGAGAASVIDDFEGLEWPASAPPSSGPISTPAAATAGSSAGPRRRSPRSCRP